MPFMGRFFFFFCITKGRVLNGHFYLSNQLFKAKQYGSQVFHAKPRYQIHFNKQDNKSKVSQKLIAIKHICNMHVTNASQLVLRLPHHSVQLYFKDNWHKMPYVANPESLLASSHEQGEVHLRRHGINPTTPPIIQQHHLPTFKSFKASVSGNIPVVQAPSHHRDTTRRLWKMVLVKIFEPERVFPLPLRYVDHLSILCLRCLSYNTLGHTEDGEIQDVG